MSLIDYIQKGGFIVYLLIGLNIIGFTIIIFKSFILFNVKALQDSIIYNIKKNNTKNMQSAIEYEIKKLESGINLIKNIATIAPLLGLLGTVIGILISFEAITENGLGNPTLFSGGISTALITTVAGLIVAIPHYLFYNYYVGFLDKLEIVLKNEISNN